MLGYILFHAGSGIVVKRISHSMGRKHQSKLSDDAITRAQKVKVDASINSIDW